MNLLLSDLKFLLAQIQVAEDHTALIRAWMAANPTATPAQIQAESANILLGLVGGNPAAPLGLRTTTGELNNLPPGNPGFSSTGQNFPRLTTPSPQTGTLLGLNGFTNAAGVPVGNTNYQGAPNGDLGPVTPGQTGNNVVDALPRFASNVIADQSTANRVLVASGAGTPATYSLWSQYIQQYGDLQGVVAAGLLKAIPGRPGVYGETILDAKTNLPVLDATNQPQLRPFGQEMNAGGQLVDEAGNVILNVPGQPLNIDQGPLNSWFTLFGQGFDHGLDLIPKNNAGRVYIPLLPSDPLYDPNSPANYMVMPRASQGDPNLVTAWVDMNQAYGSDPSYQVYIREYTLVNGAPVPTGRMLSGADGGLPPWKAVKEQALNLLGIALTDANVGDAPEIAVDDYGNFIPAANGMPMLVFGNQTVAGDLLNPVNVNPATSGVNTTGQAFLLDIGPGPLDEHFIAGDGRVNENNGLTAFHTIFHNEHDRLVAQYKGIAVQAALNGDLASLNEWLSTPLPTGATPTEISALLDPAADAQWNGDRLFQAARVVTEGQYQHIAFQEFSRVLQPTLQLFTGGGVGTDSNIPLEFSQATYRFGHSLLTEEVARLAMAANLDGTATWTNQTTGLIEAFVNPLGFTRNGTVLPTEAAGAIINGMARQVANDIDPSITGALRNNLVGLPLDLAALNIGRGNDVALPSLNEARKQFFATTGDMRLAPYTSWNDFAYRTSSGLKNPESVVNYMAVYGTHPDIVSANTVEAKRAAAIAIWSGVAQPVLDASGQPTFNADGTPVVANVPADAADYMNATGNAWAGDPDIGGLNLVDFWIGGLGEKPVSTVDRLGSTMAYVFEKTIVNLQGNDRFYYLNRFGGNLLSQIETSTLNVLAARTTGAYHLPGVSFLTAAWNLESVQGAQLTNLASDGVTPLAMGNGDPVGAGGFARVNRETPAALSALIDRTLRYNGGEHVVLGGSADRDLLEGGDGGDTLYGDDGDDYIITGAGADFAYGGGGDDVIIDTASPLGVGDLIVGEDGNDVIAVSTGISASFGGTGQDYMIGGNGAAGTTQDGDSGDDFIQAAAGGALASGGVGNDWLEDSSAVAADILNGEAGQGVILNAVTGLPEPGATETGDDVIILRGGSNTAFGDAGDDIIVDGESADNINGSAGFDWMDNSRHRQGVNVDLALLPAFAAVNAALPQLDTFDGLVEAAGGSSFNDQIRGDERANLGIVAGDPLPGQVGPVLPANAIDNSLLNPANQGGAELIKGLWSDYSVTVGGVTKTFTNLLGNLLPALRAQGVADLAAGLPNAPLDAQDNFIGGNILLGGAGTDEIYGRGGTDIIDGDASIQVQIVYTPAAGGAVQRFESMDALNQAMLNKVINPTELSIERSLVRTESNGLGTTGDTAVYRGLPSDYAIEGMVWDPNAVNRVDGRLGTFVLSTNANAALPTPAFQPQVLNDGFIQITHDPAANGGDAVNPVLGVEVAAVNDGTDYLRNIEFIRFENGTADPTQWTTIDLRPTQTQAEGAPLIGSGNTGENPLLAGLTPAPTATNGLVEAPNQATRNFFATEQQGVPLDPANNVVVVPTQPDPTTDPTIVPAQPSDPAVEVINPITTSLLQQSLTPDQQALNIAGSALLTDVPAPRFVPQPQPQPQPQPGSPGNAALTPDASPVVTPSPVQPAPVETTQVIVGSTIEEFGDVRTYRSDSGKYGANFIDGSKDAVEFVLGKQLKKHAVIGTEDLADGYQSVLKKGKSFVYATFDRDGDLLKSKALKNRKQLVKYENRLEQDLNGDGVIGKAAALKAPSELQVGDVLIGDGGRQLYALANQNGDLYASSGDADVLVIQNFQTGPAGDVLIASSASEYSLGMVDGNAAIYKGSASAGDLVAVLEGVRPTAGMHVNFSFV